MRASQPNPTRRRDRSAVQGHASPDAEEPLNDAAIDAAIEAALAAPLDALLSISEFAEKLDRPDARDVQELPADAQDVDILDLAPLGADVDQHLDPDEGPAILAFPMRSPRAA